MYTSKGWFHMCPKCGSLGGAFVNTRYNRKEKKLYIEMKCSNRDCNKTEVFPIDEIYDENGMSLKHKGRCGFSLHCDC